MFVPGYVVVVLNPRLVKSYILALTLKIEKARPVLKVLRENAVVIAGLP